MLGQALANLCAAFFFCFAAGLEPPWCAATSGAKDDLSSRQSPPRAARVMLQVPPMLLQVPRHLVQSDHALAIDESSEPANQISVPTKSFKSNMFFPTS